MDGLFLSLSMQKRKREEATSMEGVFFEGTALSY